MREIIFPEIVGSETVYMDTMNCILGNTQRNSMIDLGAHHAPHTPLFGFQKRKYVDILQNVLDYPEEQKYFIQGDILNTPLDIHYDVTFSLDCCEHLTIDNGLKLFEIMLKISDKQILFTPLTDLFGFDYETENPEAHRSLWKPEMIELFFPDTFIFITFPNYHKVWNGGAFFFHSCKGDIDVEFERIKNEIYTYSWSK